MFSPSTRSTGLEDGWSGGRLVDESFVFFIFSVDMVDMVDEKRMDPYFEAIRQKVEPFLLFAAIDIFRRYIWNVA